MDTMERDLRAQLAEARQGMLEAKIEALEAELALTQFLALQKDEMLQKLMQRDSKPPSLPLQKEKLAVPAAQSLAQG